MIKLITFDLWETIIQDVGKGENERDSLRADFILSTLGLPQELKPEIMNFFNDLVSAFKVPSEENDWSILPETQLDVLFRRIRVNPTKEQFNLIYNYYTEVILEFPPVLTEKNLKDVLIDLRKEYQLGLISNTGRTPGRVLLLLLERFNFKDIFDFFVFSDEILMRKPDPRVFQIALSKGKALGSETVHVGDSYKMDFLGAKNSNINPVLYVPTDLFPQGEPFIRSFSQLRSIIEEYYVKD